MADLPIDIHYQKLTEWLLSREKIKKRWQEGLPALKTKVETLRLRLPDDLDIDVASDGCTLHYYDCKAIFEQLKERASDVSKSWFGGYKDEQLADWSSVLKEYEKKNMFLGEAARVLERNTTYEVPFIKDTLARNEKELKDLHKKETSNLAGIESNEAAYAEQLASYGIEGKEYQSDDLLRRQLRGTSKVLARKLNAVLEDLKSDETRQAIAYHKAFVTHVNEVDPNQTTLLSTLSLVIDSAEPLEADKIGGEPVGESKGEENELEVDWNIELSTSGEGGIDWDISVDPEPQQEIDWGTGGDSNVSDREKFTEETKTAAGGSEEQEKTVTLLDQEIRRDLQNDLLELSAFLAQRQAEMSALESEGLSSLLSGLEAESPVLKGQSIASLSALHSHIESMLASLGDEKLQELILTQQGEIYLERLVERFRQKAQRIARLKVSINQICSKREHILQENRRLAQEKQAIVKRTKALKAEVEATLSSHYKGRQVNIIGDINFI